MTAVGDAGGAAARFEVILGVVFVQVVEGRAVALGGWAVVAGRHHCRWWPRRWFGDCVEEVRRRGRRSTAVWQTAVKVRATVVGTIGR